MAEELIVNDKRGKEIERHSRALHAATGCDQCKHCGLLSNLGSKELTFVCRKRPPVVQGALVMAQNGPMWQAATFWPQVNKTDYCGEFEAKLN